MSAGVRAFRPHLGPVLVGALLGSLVAGRLETAILCLAVALGVAMAAGAAPPPRRWFVTLATGAAIGWTLNLYLTPGVPLAGGWPVLVGRPATREGLALGLLLTLRVAGACAALQGLRAAWPGERAADAAARLLGPLERLRVPVREARAMLGLALRFVPLLQSEARRIARVQGLRAGRPPRGAREWLQRRRAVTVPLMVGALERAERVALALEARHYRLRPAGVPVGWGGAASAAGSSPATRAWTLLGGSLAALALLWRS
jgi:energy-coupling factor transporter transmembrane protein EcfT